MLTCVNHQRSKSSTRRLASHCRNGHGLSHSMHAHNRRKVPICGIPPTKSAQRCKRKAKQGGGGAHQQQGSNTLRHNTVSQHHTSSQGDALWFGKVGHTAAAWTPMRADLRPDKCDWLMTLKPHPQVGADSVEAPTTGQNNRSTTNPRHTVPLGATEMTTRPWPRNSRTENQKSPF